MDQTVITAIGISIVGPILSYLKIASDRRATGHSRDSEIAVLKNEIRELKSRQSEIFTILGAITELKVAMGEFRTEIKSMKNSIDDIKDDLKEHLKESRETH